DLGTAAEPMMRRLRDETGETVALFVPEGAFRLCIAEMPSSQALSFRRGVGYRERLTLGASGKAILAYMPPPLPKLDFDSRKYARELALIKERGFAISKEELIQGAVAVSAPFFDGTGRVAGSLSVFGPSARLGPSQVAKFGKLLLREAQEISQLLGKSQQLADTALVPFWIKPRRVARRTGRSLGDRARVFLIGDHEHDDLRALVHAWVSGDGVDCGRRL